MPANGNVIERIRDIREQILNVAAESLRENDERIYRGLSDVAVRITALIPPDNVVDRSADTNQSVPISHDVTPLVVRDSSDVEYETGSESTPTSGTTPIFAIYRGRIYEAELDPRRISGGGRGECVLYEGRWMTTSGAARRITGTAVNGWQNFWRFRLDGREFPIQEIRDRQFQDAYDSVPW